ncbi:hypothetical protein QFC20_006398, partial [Naganishia adeliensis]
MAKQSKTKKAKKEKAAYESTKAEEDAERERLQQEKANKKKKNVLPPPPLMDTGAKVEGKGNAADGHEIDESAGESDVKAGFGMRGMIVDGDGDVK